MKEIIRTILIFATGLLLACNNKTGSKKNTGDANSFSVAPSDNKKPIDKRLSMAVSDSIELTKLIKKVLTWGWRTNGTINWTTDKQDSTFTGVDWTAFKKRMSELSATNFFTEDFIRQNERLASHMDRELKHNKYNTGEIPDFDTESVMWCSCQDTPDNIDSTTKIIYIKNYTDSAAFQWTWDNEMRYVVKAKKEKYIWKISYMEGFDEKNFHWTIK